ncbi:lectin-like protein [Thiothrix unzii]|jgi:hypothetical protein|uniref:lectin-like protein n=1 Tax=Thiothrix unzii TaxID=111769 RepID=UPI002A36F323|nr:lectin-like protein [Thiothrix unzii]MDX9989364.1 lectin-like protein [Thiothrix unzii]
MFKLKPLASAITLSLVTGIAVAAAPGGAILQNKVIATYSDIGGKTYTAESNIVEISIREVRTATLTITSGAEQQVAMIPSSKVYSVHTLTNNGNVSETFALAAANVTGGDDTLDASALKVYLDANGNGVLDGTEGATPITSTTLAAGASAKLIVESVLPAAVALSDKLNVTLDATDSKGTAAASTNTVKITFSNSNISYVPKTWAQVDGGNCHAYAWITGGGSWSVVNAAAATQMYNGKIGHLATITSAAENTFILNNVATYGTGGVWWIGAKRPTASAAFSTWVTGEAVSYTNWSSAQPDNASGIEDSMSFVGGTGKWNDLPGSSGLAYLIEFDTDCDLPKVAVELEGAKDIACDGAADEAFGTAKLADMYSGECAILRTRATNGGKSLAKGVDLHYSLPQYASYVAGSLTFDSAAKTDAADADVGKYDAALKKILVNTGDLAAGTTSPDAQFSVKID